MLFPALKIDQEHRILLYADSGTNIMPKAAFATFRDGAAFSDLSRVSPHYGPVAG